jgi:T4 gene Gp59 loader of gp41 DNA helicase/T4 gene Gp59 loader of gp41 DNA helicase C-term
MTGYETYKLYVALKNHFISDTYDYFRYGGKTRASVKTFESRHDKYFFNKLAKHKDPLRFILANIIEDNANVWVGDLVNEQKAEENYRAWLKRQESLTYIFKQDLERLNEDFNKNFLVENGKHPLLLQLLIHRKVSLETIVILNDLCPFSKYWTRNIEEDVIWPMINKKCRKYRPFLSFDKEKFKQIVVDKFQDVK